MWSLLIGLACTAPDKGPLADDDTGSDCGPAAQDTAPASGTEDSGVGDTAVADMDTGPVDTGSVHTGSVDTAAVDTAVVDTGDGLSDDAVPDFLLADLNPSSPRCGQMVSPRDYLEEVSGWYFIHAS